MAQMALQMKMAGLERKQMAAVMAEALCTKVAYKGAPDFAYEFGRWLLTKDSMLISPPIDQQVGCTDEMKLLLTALGNAGVVVTGRMLVEIIGLDERQARNLTAILVSKANLLYQAFKFGDDGIFSVQDGMVRLDFFEATLDVATVKASLLFTAKLAAFAEKLSRVTARERNTDNPRYAFRCFLLRLGFIGDEYKAERKLLLKNLIGNGSFRSGNAPKHRQSEAL